MAVHCAGVLAPLAGELWFQRIRRTSALSQQRGQLLLCRRKGIAMESAAPITMQAYREQQFDLLADGVRHALDMPAVYAAMGLTGPKEERT